MAYNNAWLVWFVWLFCTVPINAHWHEPDWVGDGNHWESTASDERIISPELAWWYFDSGWDYSDGFYESDWLTDDRWQSNRDRDLFGDIELCHCKLPGMAHDPSFDRYRLHTVSYTHLTLPTIYSV